jgi:hypothetical protein
MLASVLNSEKAVKMSIAVVRAFISLKKHAAQKDEITEQLLEIRNRLNEHDVQLSSDETILHYRFALVTGILPAEFGIRL